MLIVTPKESRIYHVDFNRRGLPGQGINVVVLTKYQDSTRLINWQLLGLEFGQKENIHISWD